MGFFKSLMKVISTDGKTGTPFKLDKNHTVYYKGDGVTELDAAHVAGFFKGYGYFTDSSQSDVQIFADKPGDAVQIGFIIGVSSISDQTADYFRDSATGLQDIFPGRQIILRLLDVNLKELQIL